MAGWKINKPSARGLKKSFGKSRSFGDSYDNGTGDWSDIDKYQNKYDSGEQLAKQAGLSAFGEAGTVGAMGGQLFGDYQKNFQPVQSQLIEQAQYNPQRDVDTAAVDVGNSFDKSRGIWTRDMSRMGVNPNSGRFAGLEQKWALMRAAAEAGAKQKARYMGQDEAFRRLAQVQGLGLNMAQAGIGANATAMGGFNQAAQTFRGIANDAGEEAAGAQESQIMSDAIQNTNRPPERGLAQPISNSPETVTATGEMPDQNRDPAAFKRWNDMRGNPYFYQNGRWVPRDNGMIRNTLTPQQELEKHFLGRTAREVANG